MDPTIGDLASADVLVDGDRIVEVRPGIEAVDAEVIDATGYGRVLRAPDGSLAEIIEHKDALAASLQVGFASPNHVIQEQSIGIHYNQGNDLLDYLRNPEVFDYADGFVKKVGFIDLMEPKQAEEWIQKNLMDGIQAFQREYNIEAALVFWMPGGKTRIRPGNTGDRYDLLCTKLVLFNELGKNICHARFFTE